MIYELAQNLIVHIFAIGIFLKEKEEVSIEMVFLVFNGFIAGISFCDTLQSCPTDNSPPDRHFRFLKEEEEAGFWTVFRVFPGLNVGISFRDTLRSCSEFRDASFCH
jgi:hypothetical protein